MNIVVEVELLFFLMVVEVELLFFLMVVEVELLFFLIKLYNNGRLVFVQ